jgi:hypothetical protein
MKVICVLLFLLIQAVSAEEKFEVFVNTFDNDIDTSSIESPIVKATQGPGENPSQVAALPAPDEMLKIFQSANLSEEIKPLNQMDRDILYMKVTQRDLASVKKSYETISEEKLDKLKKIIEAQK